VLWESIVRRNGTAGPGLGGGIANRGSFYAERCTFAENRCALGGAIHGDAALTNCTIAFNHASTNGGGIAGTVTLESCTLYRNSCHNSSSAFWGKGGGVFGTATVHNTIIAGNTATLAGPDFSGTLNSLDYNLVEDTNDTTITGFTGHNIYGQDAMLGPLADYGSYTAGLPTLPLLSGSPAIDAGPLPASVPRDERWRSRPYGAASDIGAFESAPPWVIDGALLGSTLIEPVVMLSSAGNSVTASNGFFSFLLYSPGTYTITPSNANYHFVPASRSLTVGPDQLGVDFKAYGWNMLSTEGISNSVLHLVYAGNEGDTVRTLSSTDLVDWIPVSTNTVPATKLFDIFEPIENPTRFYRTFKP
jgi:predicted outer membrane repeat protein